MSLRKKIFGSLFIIACLGAVYGIVMWIIGPSTPDIEDLIIEEGDPLPVFDSSLTELSDDALPSFSLPSVLTNDLGGYEMDIPDVSVTPPPPNQATMEIPNLTYTSEDIQKLMADAMSQ